MWSSLADKTIFQGQDAVPESPGVSGIKPDVPYLKVSISSESPPFLPRLTCLKLI